MFAKRSTEEFSWVINPFFMVFTEWKGCWVIINFLSIITVIFNCSHLKRMQTQNRPQINILNVLICIANKTSLLQLLTRTIFNHKFFCYISLIFQHYFFTFLAVLAIMTSSSEVRFWQDCHSIFVIGSSIIPWAKNKSIIRLVLTTKNDC